MRKTIIENISYMTLLPYVKGNDLVNNPVSDPVNIKLSETEKQIIDIIKLNPYIRFGPLEYRSVRFETEVLESLTSNAMPQSITPTAKLR